MRSRVFVGLVFVAACHGRTPAGQIGEPLDLRAFLPDTLKQLVSSESDTSFSRRIKVGPDSVPVQITWTSFRHGPGRYLGTVSGKLMEPAPYDSMRVGSPSNLANDGTKDTVNATATIQVDWFKRFLMLNRRGTVAFRFNARGD